MIRQGMVSVAQARSLSIEGGVLMFIVVILSNLHINIFGQALAPVFLPAAMIYLWPRLSDVTFSLWAAFFAGLFQDLSSGVPAGGFALSWLVLWLLLNSEERDLSGGLRRHWPSFGLVILAVIVLSGVIIGLARQEVPNFMSLLYQAMISWALFPLIYLLRKSSMKLFHGKTMGSQV